MRFVTVAMLTIVLIAGVVALTLRSGGSGGGLEIIVSGESLAKDIVVYVTGEVALEGLYTLRDGDRVADAVAAAGGLSPGAATERVNLAQTLVDGQHIHIPGAGEATAPAVDAPTTLDVNTASQQALETLPGIGPGRAQAIVGYREANGPFQRVEDLLLVDGIGPITLSGIRLLISVR